MEIGPRSGCERTVRESLAVVGAVVIMAAIAIPVAVLGTPRTAAPAARSATPSAPSFPTYRTSAHTGSRSVRLYTVVRSTSLPVPATAAGVLGLVTASDGAVFLRGDRAAPSDNLFRVSLHPFALTTSTFVAGLTGATFGLGALWAAAGDLLRLDPTNLTVTGSFPLPEPARLVVVAGGKLWVATATSLLAVDPATGAVERSVSLGFRPSAMAHSPNGSILYVLGDKQPPRPTAAPFNGAVLSSFKAANGELVRKRTIGPSSTGPIATATNGVWVPVDELGKKRTTVRIELYKGAVLAPGAQMVFQAVADVVPYVADSVLWIVGIGEYRTKCASAGTGRIYASSAPVFSSGDGDMLSRDGRTFLIQHPQREPTKLLEIKPATACMP